MSGRSQELGGSTRPAATTLHKHPLVLSPASLLRRLLAGCIRGARLSVRLPDGETLHFGEGDLRAELVIHRRSALRRILQDPEYELGETYMDGGWDPGQGGLRNLLRVLMSSFTEAPPHGLGRVILPLVKLVQEGNRIGRARRNVAHHYDLDESLFRTFLDEGMFYSCAYFEREDMSLEAAQQAKCRHIMRKLQPKPGERILDIGSGWGGLAIYLAEHADVEVDGLTLSKEQLRVAEAEAARRGVSDRVHFHLRDYREHTGQYDRIVSVGMFEHVGEPNYSAFFGQVESLLAPHGVALLHTIGANNEAGATNAWIREHIFPGGFIPGLSQISREVERTGLMQTDVEILRLHYAWTLAEWYRRFQAHRVEIAERMGERFCRMWEFYLAVSEGSFLWRDLVVFHIQLSRAHGAVPTTRDYLYADRER
ncbi:SAM-dependent methyltransferase [Acidihalobacter yilgarnensis]|uniref:SAM-dependent methyltransferase n=1 Tax=Acidihalobacter yilgarnensis TaxID=2819280 RepID=UPI0009F70FA0|nr:cyclopropane-fatty-acyl-phospholipid synthase family protein [Acidihalobacter yilgarnensis]